MRRRSVGQKAVLVGPSPSSARTRNADVALGDGLVDAVRRVWSRRGDLVGAYLRAFAVVLVVLVGVPWGIRQLVGYQLVPQAVVLDG